MRKSYIIIILIVIIASVVIILNLSKDERAIKGVLEPTELAQDENGNFVLHVSNQSFNIDPVDIKIFIDNKQVVSQDFYVGTQHRYVSFRFLLSGGEHSIKIESQKGNAIYEQYFEITNKHIGVIHYLYNVAGSGPENIKSPYFSFDFGVEKQLLID